ncbi:MAG: alpha/beta fold hydrolase [Bacteroidota bacterium]
MSNFIPYKQHRIYCSINGTGETVVFLHGWPTNSQLWRAQIDALAPRYRTIAIDWLGFGQSDKPDDCTYTFTQKKDILDTVLQEVLEQDESVTLVAHDVGGPPAILWASENQKRVRQLILLNTVIFPFSTPLDKMSHFFFRVPLIREVLVSHFGLRMLMNTLSRRSNKALNSRIETILTSHISHTSSIKLKTILEPLMIGKKNEVPLLAEAFETIAAEKYLVIATKDPLCFAHMKRLRESMPEVPSFVLDNCGHFIPIDQPQALTDILTRLLGRDDKKE